MSEKWNRDGKAAQKTVFNGQRRSAGYSGSLVRTGRFNLMQGFTTWFDGCSWLMWSNLLTNSDIEGIVVVYFDARIYHIGHIGIFT